MDVNSRKISKLPFIVTAFLLCSILLLAGYFYYQKDKKHHRSERENDLSAVNELKADQLENWINERLSEALFFTAYTPNPIYIEGILSGNSDQEKTFRNLLSRLMTNDRYENIFILDAKGEIVFSLNSDFLNIDPETKSYASKVFETGRISIKDFYYCSTHEKIHFDIFAPVIDQNQKIFATLVFRINPAEFLYPLLTKKLTPGLTNESYIIKQSGDSVLFLSTLRHIDNSRLQIFISIDDEEVTAVKAVSGKTGVWEGNDYRGEKVFSDIRKIQGTDWYIITEIDRKEFFSQFKKQSILLYCAIIFFFLLIGSFISWFYHRRQKNFYKELLEKRSQLFQAQEEYGATLYSIGDGVITTDRTGRVKHLNPVAEKLTGWKEPEARGRLIDEVFVIENEDTRLKAEIPIQKVLQEGKITGLANHTILISRDGLETPISDSGAPIKDPNGNILGAIMVFKDQTEERLHRKLIEIRLRLFEYAIDHKLGETLTLMLDEICQLLKSPIGFIHFFLPDQEKLWLQAWSTRTQKEFCKAEGAGLHYNISEAGVWADAVRMKKPVIHNDYKSLKDKKGMPDGHAEVDRELVVPVIRGNKVVAIIGIGNKTDDYNDKDIEILSFLSDVTWEIAEHKLNENRLVQSEERFVQLFEKAPLGYQSLDENGNFLEINQAWLETLGYSKEEVVGKWFGDFLHHSEVEAFRERFEIFKKNGKVNVEAFVKHKSGEYLLMAIDGKIGYLDDGRVEKTHCILRDITESKLLEEKLFENERQLSSMVSNLPGFVYRCLNDDDWTMLYLSEQCKDITGYAPEDFIQNKRLTFNDLIKKEFRDELRTEWNKVLSDKSSFRKEYEIITSTGEIKWVLEFGVGVFDKVGKPLFLEGYIEDITERKLKDIQIKESEEKFRDMFHGHAAVKLIVDPDSGRIVDANEAAARFYGWSVKELTEMKVTQINILPANKVHEFVQLAKKQENGRFEFQHRKANGEVVDIENFYSKVIIGGKHYLHAIIHDISEKKSAEKSLIESEEKNRLIMNNSMDAIMLTKPDGNVLSANKAACKLFGMTEEEICAAGRNGLVDPEDNRLAELLLLREKWGFAEGELNFLRKNRSRFTADITSSLFKNSKGELFSSMIIRDITERKMWEEDLLKAKEKAEESDRLKSAFLANMSHEIRTPMNGILGFLNILNSEELDKKSRKEYLQLVNQSSQRLLDTLNDIIQISKIEAGEQEVKKSIVDVTELLDYHSDFFQLQAKQKGIALFVSEKISGSAALVESDRTKLTGILTNLVKNAIKFTTEGQIQIGNYIENDSLIFYVKDTGCGIPADKIATVFDRFMQVDISLSRNHEGSGLGLAIAKANVELLGGKIWVESNVGVGSTFYFSIPYKVKPANANLSVTKDESSRRQFQGKTILIAEDDDTSFLYLEVMLKEKNLRVFRANNGNEAVEIFKLHPEISLILMDIKMSVMDGIEATVEIRKFNVTIPIIAQTAFAFSPNEEKARQNGCNGYITKPIRPEELFTILEKYLN